MENQKLEELYERASEHYLNGRFADALQAWRELLSLNPDDERAVEGVRLAELMVDGEPTIGPEPSGVHSEPAAGPAPVEPAASIEPDVDLLSAPAAPAAAGPPGDDLDDELSLFDSLSPSGNTDTTSQPEVKPTEANGAVDPSTRGKGLDVGDLSALEQSDSPVIEDEEMLDLGDDTVGLEPVSEKATFAPPPTNGSSGATDPIEAELRKRVEDLLDDARTAVEQGRVDDARGVLARVLILDEENAEAKSIEESLEQPTNDNGAELEEWMTEGVQWLEQGQVGDARERFLLVLQAAPDHIEAKSYLEDADARLAAEGDAADETSAVPSVETGELNHEPMPEVPGLDAVPVVTSASSDLPGFSEGGDFESSMMLDDVPIQDPAPTSRKTGLLVGVVAAVVIAAAGFWLVPKMLNGKDSDSTEVAAAPAATAPEAFAPGDAEPATRGAAGPQLPPAVRAERVTAALNRGRDAMRSDDFSAAVVAFDEVLDLDPKNVEAQRGILVAGELYRDQKSANKQLDQGRFALEDGDYVSALRIFYRLPEDLEPARVNNYKVIGWYNLGLVELRGADCRKALDHFDEALSIAPEDPVLLAARDLATSYVGSPKDRLFYSEAERFQFRVPSD